MSCNSGSRCAHDVSLVDSSDPIPSMGLGIVEGVSGHAFARFPSDQLHGLNDAIDDLMLDSRVLALSVLSNEDGVDVVVGRLVALDGRTWSNVCKEVEGTSEGQVEGYVAFADCAVETAY